MIINDRKQKYPSTCFLKAMYKILLCSWPSCCKKILSIIHVTPSDFDIIKKININVNGSPIFVCFALKMLLNGLLMKNYINKLFKEQILDTSKLLIINSCEIVQKRYFWINLINEYSTISKYILVNQILGT